MTSIEQLFKNYTGKYRPKEKGWEDDEGLEISKEYKENYKAAIINMLEEADEIAKGKRRAATLEDIFN